MLCAHLHFYCTVYDHNPPTLQTDGQTDGGYARSISATCYPIYAGIPCGTSFPRSIFVVSSWHSREDVANKSRGTQGYRTSRTRMLRGSSRGCPQQVVRVGLVDLGERHRQTGSTTPHAADRRPSNQASAWKAGRGSRPTRPTRTTSRGRYAENSPAVEFKLIAARRAKSVS